MTNRTFFLIFIIFIISCKEKISVPKPKAFLDLKYPEPYYDNDYNLFFSYDLNSLANAESVFKNEDKFVFKLNYNVINASLYLNYTKINYDLKELISQTNFNLNNHAKVATQASKQDFLDENRKVYGTIYELIGSVASPTHFYVTDSVKNFLAGSLYFKTKPNYDSLLPAIYYVKNDIIRLIESLKWNN